MARLAADCLGSTVGGGMQLGVGNQSRGCDIGGSDQGPADYPPPRTTAAAAAG